MRNTERILARCEAEGDCLIWQGATHRQGYGMTRADVGMQTCHRLIGLDKYGNPGDSGKYKFTHTCGNLLCCNPEHIIMRTHSEIMQDTIPNKAPKSGKKRRMTREEIIELKNTEYWGWGCYSSLARKYDTNVTTVRRIMNGTIYKWIN